MLRTLSILTILTTSLTSQAAVQLNCTALKRVVEEGSNVAKETRVPLFPAGRENPSTIQAQIDDRVYSVTRRLGIAEEQYLITITVAPNFTSGVIATTALTDDGRMQISTVDGGVLHKLECKVQN